MEEIKNFSNNNNMTTETLKEFSNAKLILKEILKSLLQVGKKQEDIGWKKSELESNHFIQPVYRSKRTKKKKKSYYKSDNKHKEQQKDKHDDVKKRTSNNKTWVRRVRKS